MLITHDREKLIHAIIYFARNTKFCGKTKLFKLLYFLDFEHFQQTGRSVTGLSYFAWPKGPVPVDLFAEFETPQPDFAEHVHIRPKQTKRGLMYTIEPVTEFKPDKFTRRELNIIEQLTDEYRNARADDMVEATHLENLPWHQVFEVEKNRQQLIPYEYAIRRQEKEEITQLHNEHLEILKNYKAN